jgi:hypothetical protein
MRCIQITNCVLGIEIATCTYIRLRDESSWNNAKLKRSEILS